MALPTQSKYLVSYHRLPGAQNKIGSMGQVADVVGPHVDGVMGQAVDDELILFNPATETYFTLNRSAREVWDLADGTRSIDEIARDLASRYGLNADTLRDDVTTIVNGFIDAGLI